jgi:hypothetical protein
MTCPLCDTEGALVERDELGYTVSCPSCSEYSITRAAFAQWKQSRGATTRTGPLQLAWQHLAIARSIGEFPTVRVADVWGWVLPYVRA